MTNDNMTPTIPVHFEYDDMGGWRPLVQRLQGAGKGRGMSVVTVRVIVDATGTPQHWTEPDVRRIEPKARGEELAALLRKLAE